MTHASKKLTTAIVLAVVLFLTAAAIGNLAASNFEESVIQIWPGKISVSATKNFHGVFSLPLSNFTSAALSLAALGIVAVFFLADFRRRGFLFAVGFATILGGALANLFFRLRFGFVWDYMNFHFFGLTGSWNVADFLIVLGMIFWLFTFLEEWQKR